MFGSKTDEVIRLLKSIDSKLSDDETTYCDSGISHDNDDDYKERLKYHKFNAGKLSRYIRCTTEHEGAEKIVNEFDSLLDDW